MHKINFSSFHVVIISKFMTDLAMDPLWLIQGVVSILGLLCIDSECFVFELLQNLVFGPGCSLLGFFIGWTGTLDLALLDCCFDSFYFDKSNCLLTCLPVYSHIDQVQEFVKLLAFVKKVDLCYNLSSFMNSIYPYNKQHLLYSITIYFVQALWKN